MKCIKDSNVCRGGEGEVGGVFFSFCGNFIRWDLFGQKSVKRVWGFGLLLLREGLKWGDLFGTFEGEGEG